MARDLFHDAARKSLENDGWTITHDPFLIPINTKGIYADLGAERTLAAEKDKELIVVEVKSFIGLSLITDFYKAIGQYELYALALKKYFPERHLYLAIPESAYKKLTQDPFLEEVLVSLTIKLIVFRIDKEEIAEMDKVAQYNQIARSIVEEVAAWSSSANTIETMEAIDETHGQYLLLSDGWLGDTRMYGPLIHIEVKKDGKVWLRHDGTDLEIGQRLLNAGVAPSDLVPAFHDPVTRQYTGYAVA